MIPEMMVTMISIWTEIMITTDMIMTVIIRVAQMMRWISLMEIGK